MIEGLNLVEYGVAGLLLGVVVLFLRAMKEERNDTRTFFASQQKTLFDEVRSLQENCHESHEKIAARYTEALETHTKLETAQHETMIEKMENLK